MSKVEEAIIELQAALADFTPKHGGLRDFARLNLKPETAAEVNEAIGRYNQRESHMQQAITALQHLVGDGYPDLVLDGVSDTTLADLEQNASTIQAALGEFRSNAANTLGLSAGAPESKD